MDGWTDRYVSHKTNNNSTLNKQTNYTMVSDYKFEWINGWTLLNTMAAHKYSKTNVNTAIDEQPTPQC